MKLLIEGIIFLTYAIICGGLAKSRFNKKHTILTYIILTGSIVLIQAIFLFLCKDLMLVLTLLPLTVYFPFSIGLYFFSDFGFGPMTIVWMIAYLAVFILRIFSKIFYLFYSMKGTSLYADTWLLLLYLPLAASFLFLVFRFLRKPLHEYMEKNQTEWLILSCPVLISYLLLSYFCNSVTNTTALILALLTAMAIFFMIIRFLNVQAVAMRMKESEERINFQMQMQRQEYENICRKMDAGRIYRHDMRHHLLVLKTLAVEENSQEILKYIENMNGQLSETERGAYCMNPIINAVLSACFGRAKEEHCVVLPNIILPQAVPFDEMDICMIFANTLENAINACKEISEEGKRYIHISAEIIDHKKLILSIKNPFDSVINFDDDGIPISSKGEGHGIGFKSIRAITDKYHGFFHCKCENNEFCFQAVLFTETSKQPAAKKKNVLWKKAVTTISLSIFVVFFYLSFVPEAVQAASAIREELSLQFAGIHAWNIEWGDTFFNASYPNFEIKGAEKKRMLPTEELSVETGDDAEELNQQIQAYVKEMKEKFLWYVSRKYRGYAGMDISWETLRDDEEIFSIVMKCTLNAGGSGQYSRYFMLDKETGKLLELQDLFLEESDYIGIISKEVLRQMKEQIDNKKANYYVSGYGWAEQDCFRRIDSDQNFYIDEDNRLVIVFDEYEVAPGNMGMPKFSIEKEILEEILKQPSLIR